MASTLAWNRYGKSQVRLVKLRRSTTTGGSAAEAAPHDIVDLTIDVRIEGAFESLYVDGDNRSCLPTDTMKNTIYALARQDPIEHVEIFGSRLAAHFATKTGVARVRIDLAEDVWQHVDPGGVSHPHAFIRSGNEQWIASVIVEAGETSVVSGVNHLVVLKTSGSAFAGFPRDEFTTLAETTDRILATSIDATWRYRAGVSDFSARNRIRAALIETFARHDSHSLQHTLYAMAEAALAACGDATEITLSLPNRHHVLVDLSPFGLDNPNDIFVATDRPFGLIEATVRR